MITMIEIVSSILSFINAQILVHLSLTVSLLCFGSTTHIGKGQPIRAQAHRCITELKLWVKKRLYPVGSVIIIREAL